MAMDKVTIALLVLASMVALYFRYRFLALSGRVAALEHRQPDILQAAAEPHSSAKVWLHLVGPVLLGAVLTTVLNIAGCNTTPTQSRVGKLEDDMKGVQTFDAALPHTFVPRDEMETKTAAVDKIQAQRDKRIDGIEATQTQMLGYLMGRGVRP